MKNTIRQFEIMNECERVDINKIKEWLYKINCSFLIVLHDKDQPRTPHYHIFVKMENARTIKDISNQCGIEPQYIEKIKKWKNALAYAFHLTSGARDDGKYQYTKDNIISYNNIEIDEIFKLSNQYIEKQEHEKMIVDKLYDYGECNLSKNDLMELMTAQDYDKYSLRFKKMQEYRRMKVKDRDMQVIYITGKSGCGKTTLAKYMARIENYDYFVSGSGRDVLDGYDKEECIILDDFRADAFTKAELFKLTDNNTNSSVKSRYMNKDISYCKMMIITSIKTPRDLYNWDDFTDKDETFKQFARRLNNRFIYIDEKTSNILECVYDLDYINTTKRVQPINMNAIFSLLGFEKKIGSNTMDRIFKAMKEESDKQQKDYDELPF